jgi:20S proteasome subunit alpha 2
MKKHSVSTTKMIIRVLFTSNNCHTATLLWCLIWLCLCNCLLYPVGAASGGGFYNDGRYSYSLSFFDPNGKLGQVERANQAAASGVPILVLIRDNDRVVVMAAPHILPNALTIDSGTPRFARVSSRILISHTGITADGRVLMTAAQRLAIEHEYVFDEDIPIAVFLEEMSLLFQEYTMKEGVRPFGASLIVASLSDLASRDDDENDDDDSKDQGAAASRGSQIYRIDPSGSVTALGRSFALVNGGDSQPAAERMRNGLAALHSSSAKESFSVDNDLKSLVGILQNELLLMENGDHRSRLVSEPQPNRLDSSPADNRTFGARATIKTAVFSLGNALLEQEIHHLQARAESME